jgi:hypothetical protein
MKNIFIILSVAFAIQCKAQSPIIDLMDRDGTRLNNAYYKDVYNRLNPFEGTWLYTNGTTSLKIVLVKKEMKRLGTYYEDLLIGELQYIDNGVEKFNSLADINTVYPNEYKHSIVGNHIPTTPTPFDQYIPGEVRVQLMFEDNRGGNINVRKTTVGGQDAIQIWRVCGYEDSVVGDPPLPLPIVPIDIYTLIKQ